MPDSSAYPLLVVVASMLVGVVLRVTQFFSGRSIWHDEALLAINLMHRPFDDVVGRLHFAQATPIPFAVAEWIVGRSLGYSEEALRLLPLAAGVMALVFFAVLAGQCLEQWAGAIATVLFAVANGLIFYSSELKPYSSDVLVATLVLLIATRIASPLTTTRTIVLGVCGGGAMLFSYSSLFVAGPALLVVLFGGGPQGRRQSLGARTSVAVVWALAAIAVALDARARTGAVHDEFAPEPVSSEAPLDPSGFSVSHAVYLLDRLVFGVFETMGFAQEKPLAHAMKLVALACVLGLVALVGRRPSLGALVALPFAAVFVAAALDLYPITERTTLFLLPCLIVMLAEGVSLPLRLLRGSLGATVTAIAAAIVLAFPLYSAAYHLLHPRKREEMRSVLETLQRRWSPGDTLYLHLRAQYAFRYYAECNCIDSQLGRFRSMFPYEPIDGEDQSSPALLPSRALILGKSTLDPAVLRRELAPRHGRVWVLYSHVSGNEELTFVQTVVPRVLGRLGARLATVRRRGAAALLYDLSTPSREIARYPGRPSQLVVGGARGARDEANERPPLGEVGGTH